MAKYRKISDLFDAVEKEVSKALQGDSFISLVKDSMITMIEHDVYRQYNPSYYERKEDQGGLTDKKNIVAKIEDNDKTALRVSNIRRDEGSEDFTTTLGRNAGRYITPIIVTGKRGNLGVEGGGGGYNFYRPLYNDFDKNGQTFLSPRNFLASTVDLLYEENKATNALKKELAKRKIRTK